MSNGSEPPAAYASRSLQPVEQKCTRDQTRGIKLVANYWSNEIHIKLYGIPIKSLWNRLLHDNIQIPMQLY